MKKYAILSIILFLSQVSLAQLYKESQDVVIQDENGKVLEYGLAGGLNQPQFSNMDVDGDGKKDLVVFDRSGSKLLVFISQTTGGQISYMFDPSYEEFFPEAKGFLVLKDYNDDGKEDVWLFTHDSLELYQNNSTSTLAFDLKAKLIAYDHVNPSSFNPFKKLSPIRGSFPAIYDIDGDKDIDFISNLNVNGSNMIFNKNVSVDSGQALEDIEYEIIDKCYGGLAEENFNVILNAECIFAIEKYKKKHTATKTLLFFDNDGDGDNDLFLGTSEQISNPMLYLENGKSDLSFYKDTFIRIDTGYFPQAIESQIPVSPGMFSVDVDLDGELDLVLSTNDADRQSYPVRETNNVLMFLNKGTTDDPIFIFQQNDFLVEDMVDFGSYTAPAFADLDDDGDLDMVLATAGNHYERADTSDFLVYYENVGDSSSPKFKLMNDDYLGFKSMSYQGLVPSFADIDGDEDLDLFFGNRNGSIMYYENGGAKSAASFTYKTDTFLGIKVQSSSAPSFYDMNKDGKLDLLLGSYGGNIEYHENTGTSTSPAFTLMEDTLGGILVNELIKQNILGPDGFRDTFIHLYYGYSSPQVVSWGNGALCLAVGGDEGLVRVFDINSDLSTYFEENTDYMKTSVTKTDYIKDWGSRIRPASADLNGDGVSDLMIGLSRGGLQYMEGIEDAKTGNITSQKLESFNVYPNPTDGSVTIFASSKGMLHYEIMDLSGKILREGNTISGQSSDMASSLKNGVYFITLKEGNRQFATQKLVVAR